MSLFTGEGLNGAKNDLGFKAPEYLVVSLTGLSATAATRLFVAEAASKYKVYAVKAAWSTASTSVNLDIEKVPSATAMGSGTTITSSSIDTSATANTPVSGALSANPATVTLAANDSLATKVSGTAGSIAGLQVTIYLVRLPS